MWNAMCFVEEDSCLCEYEMCFEKNLVSWFSGAEIMIARDCSMGEDYLIDMLDFFKREWRVEEHPESSAQDGEAIIHDYDPDDSSWDCIDPRPSEKTSRENRSQHSAVHENIRRVMEFVWSHEEWIWVCFLYLRKVPHDECWAERRECHESDLEKIYGNRILVRMECIPEEPCTSSKDDSSFKKSSKSLDLPKSVRKVSSPMPFWHRERSPICEWYENVHERIKSRSDDRERSREPSEYRFEKHQNEWDDRGEADTRFRRWWEMRKKHR